MMENLSQRHFGSSDILQTALEHKNGASKKNSSICVHERKIEEKENPQ